MMDNGMMMDNDMMIDNDDGLMMDSRNCVSYKLPWSLQHR